MCLFSNYQLTMEQALALVWGFSVEKDKQVSHIGSFILVIKDIFKKVKNCINKIMSYFYVLCSIYREM